ncbi:hypothetical protein FRC09_013096 [Ceratobasidium sp. 395]|nr:hypothetical protein FRC09_013096 [Ceratobasidium sp. 395]
MMRDSSTTLAPINTLPPEILACIFALWKPYWDCFYDDGLNFHDLAAVCSYWRQVAINTPELWAHIDIGPSTPVGFTELFLKRAGDSPIYMHLNEANTSISKPTSMEKMDQTMSLLSQHLHHVFALDINSDGYFPDLITRTLNTWLACSGKELSRVLVVDFPNAKSVLSFSDTLMAEPENAEEMLRSLTMVNLENIYFDWNSKIYWNLRDLRLVFDCDDGNSPAISTLEFANILTASPELEMVKLVSLEIREAKDWARETPIAMEHLSILHLVNMEPDSLRLLLPLIAVSGPLPEIVLGIAVGSQMQDEFEAFLVRSKITTLYCVDQDDSYSGFFPLPCRQLVGDLRILVLDNLSIVETMSGGTNRRISQPSAHPLSVTLVGCTVNLGTLKTFILDYSIQTLCFEVCQLDPVAKHDFEDLHGLRDSLLETFPELDCTVSDVDSAWDWVCYKMYDDPTET